MGKNKKSLCLFFYLYTDVLKYDCGSIVYYNALV